MTNIFALLFFILTQSTAEQQLAEKYRPAKTNLKQPCPKCGSLQTIKNGSTHNGKPKCQCNQCGRQFVLNPSQKTVSEETKQLMGRFLLERLSLRGIERATVVSCSWLQNYVNDKFAAVPSQVSVSEKARGKLIIECDELWSFGFSKENKFYVWLAHR
jgi:transposase-like protein